MSNAIWEAKFYITWEMRDGETDGCEEKYNVSAESLEEAISKVRKTARSNYAGKLTLEFSSILRTQFLDA